MNPRTPQPTPGVAVVGANMKGAVSRLGDDMSSGRHVLLLPATLLAVLLTMGCRKSPVQEHPHAQVSATGAAAVAPSASRWRDAGMGVNPPPAPSTREPAQDADGPPDHELHEAMAKRVQDLAAALAANDRDRFTRGLFYPVRVNTSSWCTVSVTTPGDFLRHFDEIVTEDIRRALRRPDLVWGPRGAAIGEGQVYFADADWKPSITFNSDGWEVKGIQCEGWKVTETPSWLGGVWRVSSAAVVPGEMNQDAPAQWDGGSLRIDLEHRTVDIALNDDRRRCKPLRFGFQLNEPELRGLDAASNGFESALGKPYFFDLDCSNEKKVWRRFQRIDVLGRELIALPSGQGFFVVLKPERLVGSPTKTAAAGEPCGARSVRCVRSAVCVYSGLTEAGQPREACASRGDPIGGVSR
jgi:hypothetical protein